MASWELEFGVTSGGKLLAYPSPSTLWVMEFVNNEWVPFGEIFGVWLDAKPITEEEAMRLTSGVMPE